jgi:hypothetical protein
MGHNGNVLVCAAARPTTARRATIRTTFMFSKELEGLRRTKTPRGVVWHAGTGYPSGALTAPMGASLAFLAG